METKKLFNIPRGATALRNRSDGQNIEKEEEMGTINP
ncbi:unnamed protein product [Protopolystoma xenopodis]|uniref:Uncharacterized protein n=1 Tax=Protopolystoma xenopodis TaxID=117903 RepID=A0A3S5CNC6_9PLAT|nr:unnamed protein product [Protopolystoma xenopodis]